MEVIEWGLGKVFRGNVWLVCPFVSTFLHLAHKADIRLVVQSNTDFYHVPEAILGMKNSLLEQYLFLAICQILLILGKNTFINATDLT